VPEWLVLAASTTNSLVRVIKYSERESSLCGVTAVTLGSTSSGPSGSPSPAKYQVAAATERSTVAQPGGDTEQLRRSAAPCNISVLIVRPAVFKNS